MLYIFQVDEGEMRTFAMDLAIQSVDVLRNFIEQKLKIPKDKQVLLISGGEHLEPDARVGSYSAGTDTNPIFLFFKPSVENPGCIPIAYSIVDVSEDTAELHEFHLKLKNVLELKPTLATLATWVALAQEFSKRCKEQLRICEKLIYEQHVQQQGWAAVIANLDDNFVALKQRFEIYKLGKENFMQLRNKNEEMLRYFQNDLITLEKIPLLHQLVEFTQDLVPEESTNKIRQQSEDDNIIIEDDENNDNNEREGSENKDEENQKITQQMSLLAWILKTNSSLDELLNSCSRSLFQFNEKYFDSLEKDVTKILKEDSNLSMKEVEGLSARLSGLEELMRTARKIEQEQNNLALSFFHHKVSIEKLNDLIILEDLRSSHREQLEEMYRITKELFDIKRRCKQAKHELCVNLNVRLKWVTVIQHCIIETDNKLVIFHQRLIQLQKQLEVLNQIHLTPALYLKAITEVVRRRNFSQSFSLWASDLACHLLKIHNDELTRRREFQLQFDGHFLNALFPGMDDLPPAFATQAPPLFDTDLPKITEDDLNQLKEQLPDLIKYLNIPMTSSLIIPNLLMIRSGNNDDDDDNGNDKIQINNVDEEHMVKEIEEKLNEIVKEIDVDDEKVVTTSSINAAATANIVATVPITTTHGLPHLKDLDRGCESETDTEEFEKVGQSPLDLHFDKDIPSPRPPTGTQDASTLTEVGDRSPLLPPKKPPRTFFKPQIQTQQQQQDDINTTTSTNNNLIIVNSNNSNSLLLQRTLSVSGSQSNTESFTNLKNPSLESIDELSSLKNFNSTTESCFNSHHHSYNNLVIATTTTTTTINSNNCYYLRSKSISPHTTTPQSPKDILQMESPNSPILLSSHHLQLLQQQQQQQQNDFVNDEFYIDESLPSSLSIETTGQLQGEFVKQLDTANNVVALLQDNLQNSQSECEKLKLSLIKMANLSKETISPLKDELKMLRIELESDLNVLKERTKNVSFNVRNLKKITKYNTLEMKHSLIIEHELEIDDFRKIVRSKIDELKNISDQNILLQGKLINLEDENKQLKSELLEHSCTSNEIDCLKQEIEQLKNEKEKCIKDVTDRLKNEYRNELENIRCRFKLMTMERTPSENSLERIETSFVTSGTSNTNNTETKIFQLTEHFQFDKELAINEAINKENEKWEKILNDKICELKQQFELTKNDLINKIAEEKDVEIGLLRASEQNLLTECNKLKETIQKLIDNTENSEIYGKSETNRLSQNSGDKIISEATTTTSDMNVSVAVCEGKIDATTSPVRHRRSMSKSRIASTSNSLSSSTIITTSKTNTKVATETCKPGDTVMILWDTTHKNYKVVQNSNTIYFVHPDSLSALGLEINNGEPNFIYCIADVIEKEYCHAKKSENRYKVPKGTKFFRVLVKPFKVSGYKISAAGEILKPTPTTSTPLVTSITLTTSPTTPSSSGCDGVSGGGGVAGFSDSLDQSDIVLSNPPLSPSVKSVTTSFECEKNSEIDEKINPSTSGITNASSNTNDKVEGEIENGTELTENFEIDNNNKDNDANDNGGDEEEEDDDDNEFKVQTTFDR